ncbi:hypothetical protein B0H66DRAFT_321161 [Apodospora peruviana]|uniref:Uncharacterized protein n=1 Tax=Apodospora peruviana TaxID=516989 RepID=A0AAE0HXS8_9PEZI|nr:hypothetical protein B0H66DRAFT_321161 [Apodospora peruviana]
MNSAHVLMVIPGRLCGVLSMSVRLSWSRSLLLYGRIVMFVRVCLWCFACPYLVLALAAPGQPRGLNHSLDIEDSTLLTPIRLTTIIQGKCKYVF